MTLREMCARRDTLLQRAAEAYRVMVDPLS
jgi:hypothetical protein